MLVPLSERARMGIDENDVAPIEVAATTPVFDATKR